ncbi:MAG: hypothetical protein JXQ65_12560 [Candidatus Marinimicrobia bacterium]|nr:hypothetical protein [Candidatus Neomarinimicrobiota bacterium]
MFKWLSLLIISILLVQCNPVFIKKSQPRTLEHYIKILGNEISRNHTGSESLTIAVLEFYGSDDHSIQLGPTIADELTVRLFNAKKFKVIERQLLNKVIEEQRLSLSGHLDEQSVKSIGKILGVDAIVTGTFSRINDQVNLYARLISTETGEIFSVAKTQVPFEIVKPLTFKDLSSESNPLEIKVVQKNDLVYELSEVQFNNNQLTCEIRITSKEKDQEVVFFGRNTITTSTGKVYKNRFRSIGDQKTEYISSALHFKLFKDVPYTYVLNFDEIFDKPSIISVLELDIKDGLVREFIQFRNIEIE